MKNCFFTLLLFFSALMAQAQVGIGTVTPNSTLTVEGSVATKTDVVSGFPITLNEDNHTILSDDVVNLPDPSTIIGREYVIKTDAGGATVNAQPGDLIDGSPTLTLNPLESVRVKAVGADDWLIIGGKFDSSGAEAINDLTDGITLNQSVYLGQLAGVGASGSQNVALGDGALINADGNDNIAIGHVAGGTIDTGNKNIVIGFEASGVPSAGGLTTGSNNILIGDRVNASGQTVSNELNIGDAIYATGLYGTTAQVGVGNANNAPNSTFSVNGSMSTTVRSGDVNTTLTDTDYTYFRISGNVTLPAAAGKAGRIYVIKNVLTTPGNNMLRTTGSDRIDSFNQLTLDGGETLVVQSNGNNRWYIIARYIP